MLDSNAGVLWDSGKVVSGASTQVVYNGPKLNSRQRYFWQVRVWNEHGISSAWSSPAWWEMALLVPSDWTARWIESPLGSRQVAMLRRAFTLRGKIKQARAYITSHGLYQVFLNGQRVGDAELTPGFTSYHKRLQYQTYDVTGMLNAGNNVIAALLGEGWYAGTLGTGDEWSNRPHRYGDRPGLFAQIEVTYQDGSSDRVNTDEGWKASLSPILFSGFYEGESYDARLEQLGWNQPGFDDAHWSVVKTTSNSSENLIAQSSAAVRKFEQITPKSITRLASGEAIVDMGQNIAGWVRLSVQGPAGKTVTLRHGEVLDAHGHLYTQNLGTAEQTVHYTLSGRGQEVYEPHFAYQGFRYVAVEGYPGNLTPRKITGIVLRSGIEESGQFETSNPLLNRLQQNIVWSQRDNFIDIPTDCPQRDERLGWTGDAQIFAPTAAFNANVSGFFEKWLKDLTADQYSNGSVPWVVPNVLQHLLVPASLGGKPDGVAGWGDAATIIPWTLYLEYADRQVLEEHYSSMMRWVDYERSRAGVDLIWRRDFQFGDWADYGFGTRGGASATPAELVATAYFAHSTDLLTRIARLLGKNEDAARYRRLFDDVRAAFNRTFVTKEAQVGTGSQASYVLALQFGLLPEGQRATAATHLAETVRREGHLTTGFLGTPGLLFALSENGHLDDAYRLLLQDKPPSWLYPITRGATTMWERWDGIKPDGSFQDPGMNSFNHYAYGSVGEWMYRVIAGINVDPVAPGYKHVLIYPQPGGGLTRASAIHLTPYGRVSSAWRIAGHRLHLAIEIPPNTTADVTVPGAGQVLEGKRLVSVGHGVRAIRRAVSSTVIELGSGVYQFSLTL